MEDAKHQKSKPKNKMSIMGLTGNQLYKIADKNPKNPKCKIPLQAILKLLGVYVNGR